MDNRGQRTFDNSGSTTTCFILSAKHVTTINLGDSRGVYCNDLGNIVFVTEDHKPDEPREAARIAELSGRTTQKMEGFKFSRGVWYPNFVTRINGFSVSRSFGDYYIKKRQLMSIKPDINVIDRVENEKFIVLATDGLWDWFETEDMCRFINERFKYTNNVQLVTESVMDLVRCSPPWSDNVTISLMLLTKLSEAKICENVKNFQAKEQKFDAHIAKEYKGNMRPLLDFLFSRRIEKYYPGYITASKLKNILKTVCKASDYKTVL